MLMGGHFIAQHFLFRCLQTIILFPSGQDAGSVNNFTWLYSTSRISFQPLEIQSYKRIWYLCLQTFCLFLFQFSETRWFTSTCIVCDAACAEPTSANLPLCNKAMCIRCKAALNISTGAQWVTSPAGCSKEANNGGGNGSAHFLWKGITFLIYH